MYYYITFEDREGNRFNFCHTSGGPNALSDAIKIARDTRDKLTYAATAIKRVIVREVNFEQDNRAPARNYRDIETFEV